MDEPERRYLIIIRADKGPATIQAIQSAKEALERLGRAKPHLAFTSADGAVAGFFIKANKPAAVIRAAIESSSSYQDRGFAWVLEIGEEFAAIGSSSGWQWLQH